MQGLGNGPYQLSHVLCREFMELRAHEAEQVPPVIREEPAKSRDPATGSEDGARSELKETIESLGRVEKAAKEARETVEKALSGDISSEELKRRRQVYRAAHALKFSALCLSGGGIRSASFALGVMQGLADAKLLSKFDYLSTVSGGGYIGSWLTAWLRDAAIQNPGDTARAGRGADQVLTALRSRRPQADREPLAIQHLREYSSFLTPKVGLTSADTWAAVAILFRNMLLNWLLLVPVICVPVIAVKLVAALAHTAEFGPQGWFHPWLLLLCTVLALIAVGYRVHRTSAGRAHADNSGSDPKPEPPKHKLVLWGLFVATAIAGIALAFATPLGGVVPLICAVLVALSVGYKLQGLYFVRDIQPAAREQKLFLWLSVFPAILAGTAAAWLANLRDNSVLKFVGRAGSNRRVCLWPHYPWNARLGRHVSGA